MEAHTYSFSTWKAETGRAGVQDQLHYTSLQPAYMTARVVRGRSVIQSPSSWETLFYILIALYNLQNTFLLKISLYHHNSSLTQKVGDGISAFQIRE